MNQYNENMQRVYDDLQTSHETLNTPCVSALEKLNASGNNLYIGTDGKLYAVPVGYGKTISKYLENNELVVKSEAVVESGVFCDTSANLI